MIADLAPARERLENWDMQRRGWGGTRVGLQRIYARGRRNFAAAYSLPSDEAFHDWRKQVKYLWYHTQILENIWPSVMQALVEELDQLGELLGQDHDLAVLRTTVRTEFPRAGATATLLALERRIDAVAFPDAGPGASAGRAHLLRTAPGVHPASAGLLAGVAGGAIRRVRVEVWYTRLVRHRRIDTISHSAKKEI